MEWENGDDAPFQHTTSLNQKEDDNNLPTTTTGSASSNQLASDQVAWKMFSAGSKLYGRQKERENLIASWNSCCEEESARVVIITGAPGTGKASLAKSLRPVVNRHKPKSFFLSGKYVESRYTSSGSHDVLATAFGSYVDQLCECGDSTLISRSKLAIQKALKDDALLLTRMMPAFERILSTGEDQSSSEFTSESFSPQSHVHGPEESFRSRAAFARAAAAICSCSPLTLCLNDFQWADSHSVEYLKGLLNYQEGMKLLVVVTVREESTIAEGTSHSLLSSLRDAVQADALTELKLCNLRLDDIRLLLADMLKKDKREVDDLTRFVYNICSGNIFYLFQLLRKLADEGILTQVNGRWYWDSEKLTSRDEVIPDSFELVLQIIHALSRPVQEALKIAAVLGTEIDSSAIDRVLQAPSAGLLQQAADEGLLTYHPEYGGYRFSHDLTKQAAFTLIAEEERDKFHLYVGRRLWRSSSSTALHANIMMIVSLMNKGKVGDYERRERYTVAELNLKAAHKALRFPFFADAATYLQKGIEFLGDSGWGDRYHLALELFSTAAEVEFINGNLEFVAFCIDEVVSNGLTIDDRFRAYSTLIRCMDVRDNFEDAQNVCVDILKQLGEKLPSAPSQLVILREFLKVKFSLRNKSDEKLLSLPPMKDKLKIQCMEILSLGFLAGWRAKSPLASVFAFRLVLMTLKFGRHESSCIAFAMFGFTLCGLHIDEKEGHRFGRLAIAMAELDNLPKYIAWVHQLNGIGIQHWGESVEVALKSFEFSSRLFQDVGIIGQSETTRAMWCLVALHSSKRTLSSIKPVINFLHSRVDNARRETLLLCYLQVVHCYEGSEKDPSLLLGSRFDLEHAVDMAKSSNDLAMVMVYLTLAGEQAYVFNEFSRANEYYCRVMRAKEGPTPAYCMATSIFFQALAAIAEHRNGIKKWQNIRFGRSVLKKFVGYSKLSPESFLHLRYLLEAEIESLKNGGQKQLKALHLYDQAISIAGSCGDPKMEGIACERKGDYLLSTLGTRSDAIEQWSRAAQSFEDWGASAKAKMLLEKCGD